MHIGMSMILSVGDTVFFRVVSSPFRVYMSVLLRSLLSLSLSVKSSCAYLATRVGLIERHFMITSRKMVSVFVWLPGQIDM